MLPAELQKMFDELSQEGREQFEEIKRSLGIHYDNDPNIPYFLGVVSVTDRFKKFAPKFAEIVRQSCHEAREDSVKCSQITMSQVVEKGMVVAAREMTASHSAAMRELTSEATQVIRSAQPPTKNWRFVASVALIFQVLLLAAVGFGGWWYRDHQASEATAWSQTFEGKQAAEFYDIVKRSVPNPAFLHSRDAVKDIRSVLAWAVSQAGVNAWQDWENSHKRQK